MDFRYSEGEERFRKELREFLDNELTPEICQQNWDYVNLDYNYISSTTGIDKHTGKVVGKPYRGKPDLRFGEGK